MTNIKALILVQVLIVSLWFYSFEFFINFEIAWLSAFLIMLGSMYSYHSLVKKRVETYEANLERDVIDKIDDPYDLYSEDTPHDENDAEPDIKEVIKEEKARLKANKVNGIKTGAPATLSFFRLLPYFFLVIGFAALKNNELLMILPYLLGLGVGIVSAFFVGKIFINRLL
jgi:hypothetical protein